MPPRRWFRVDIADGVNDEAAARASVARMDSHQLRDERAARTELERLAAEQAALRRVATLVAQGVPPPAVFAAVAQEASQVVPAADFTMVGRYDGDASIEVMGGWSATGQAPVVGRRARLGGHNVSTAIFQSHTPARVDDLSTDASAVGTACAGIGMRSSVGAPISVLGELWGVLIVGSTERASLPAGTQERLSGFTELVATAIGNAYAQGRLDELIEEQIALRRVATAVARGQSRSDVFSCVVEEAGKLLQADVCIISRYEEDGRSTGMAAWSRIGSQLPVNEFIVVGGQNVTSAVQETGRPARMDDYGRATGLPGRYGSKQGFRSGAGAPISIDGRLWGMAFVAKTGDEKLPPRAEERLAQFTDLVATAIANSEARSELHRIAQEQSALRRVATLVARAATAGTLFDAVAQEVGQLLAADRSFLARYEGGNTVRLLARWSANGNDADAGQPSVTPAGTLATRVRDTGRTARIESTTGSSAATWEKWNIHCAAGAPITVGGRLWGLLGVACTGESPPGETEERLAEFADLVTTAIANAEARAELTASRARIVASAVEARRQIERDLHDGAQQRLVSLALQLQAVRASVPPNQQGVVDGLDHVAAELTNTINELRELARGIHPAVLTEGGLLPAVKALARRSAVPVVHEVAVPNRLPEQVEEAAYYIICEALTNATKHARASTVHIRLHVVSDVLHLSISDDGIGGIDPATGSGLIGLRDRAEALGGTLDVSSPSGHGTQLIVQLPIDITGYEETHASLSPPVPGGPQ